MHPVNDNYAETQDESRLLRESVNDKYALTESKSHSLFTAYLSLTVVNDKCACTFVIDWSQ